MVSTRSTTLFIAVISALASQGYADATPCGADNYSKVAAAVQTLHANCASWAAYLANGGVWNCDSTCHDAVSNLVNTLPDCTFGGPYGQNYKDVVEDMVATCGGQDSSTPASATAPSSTTTAPSATTATPISTTAAPTSSTNSTTSVTTNETADAPTSSTDKPTATSDKHESKDTNNASTSASASASAGDTESPASDVSTTSGANTETVTSITALVLVVASMLLH